MDGLIVGFLVFISLCLLFIAWALKAAEKALDKHLAHDDEAWIEAMKRWPP